MRLCGINIPFEYSYSDPVASSRIHSFATVTENPEELLTYDSKDIAGTLSSIIQAALGINDAAQQGRFLDVNKNPISMSAVKKELNILNEDLKKIIENVSRISNTVGQQRWSQLVPQELENGLDTLYSLSETFKNTADTLDKMKLCGTNIPWEENFYEKTAANRIHEFAKDAEDTSTLLMYDNADIAGTLESQAEAATGIWEAVQQGIYFDVEKKMLDITTVKQELNFLSVDLQNSVNAILNTTLLPEGQKRWCDVEPNVHGRVISIRDTVNTMVDMSHKFQKFAAML